MPSVQGDNRRIVVRCWRGKELQQAEVVPPRPPEFIPLLGRDPGRHCPQRRGFAIRHVGWSLSSGRETGVTSWAPRQLHSCSGDPLSLGLQRLLPTGAGLGSTRVVPRLACLLQLLRLAEAGVDPASSQMALNAHFRSLLKSSFSSDSWE